MVRVLVATDAASEGLNLHRTARALLHYDLPWEPVPAGAAKRPAGPLWPGARTSSSHYFLGSTDSDLAFLNHVLRKAERDP